MSQNDTTIRADADQLSPPKVSRAEKRRKNPEPKPTLLLLQPDDETNKEAAALEAAEYYVMTINCEQGLGFNPHSSEGYYILGRTNGSVPAEYADFGVQVEHALRSLSGVARVRFGCNYSGYFLQLHKDEMLQVERVIQSCLDLGIDLLLQNIFETSLRAGQHFSWLTYEARVLTDLEEMEREWFPLTPTSALDRYPGEQKRAIFTHLLRVRVVKWQWMSEYNWITAPGQAFARFLQTLEPTEWETQSKVPFSKWPRFVSAWQALPVSPHRTYLEQSLAHHQ